jgi:hypothetical protein
VSAAGACVVLSRSSTARRDDAERAGSLSAELARAVAQLPSISRPNDTRVWPAGALPKNRSGKVDQAALREWLHGVAGQTGTQPRGRAAVQSNALVAAVASAFQQALRLPEPVTDRSFRALGGDSIAAALAAHRLGEAVPGAAQPGLAARVLEADSATALASELKLELGVHCAHVSPTVSAHAVAERPLSPNTLHAPTARAKRAAPDASAVGCPRVVALGRAGRAMEWPTPTSLMRPGHRRRHTESAGGAELVFRWRVGLEKCIDATPLLVLQHVPTCMTPAERCADGCTARAFIGSHAGRFVCVDMENGATLWCAQLPDRVESSAAASLDGAVVVVGCYDGVVYGLDANSGGVRWRAPTGDQVKCSPAVDARDGSVWCGSHSGLLLRLRPEDGAVLFKLQMSAAVFASPLVDAERNRVLVATTKGAVACLDPTLRPAWSWQASAPVFAGPALLPDGDCLVAAVDGTLVRLAGATGSPRWTFCVAAAGVQR